MACGIQKAEDYQVAGGLLIGLDISTDNNAVEELLNNLCNTDNNESKNITISEIDEYLNQ